MPLPIRSAIDSTGKSVSGQDAAKSIPTYCFTWIYLDQGGTTLLLRA
jgi:hypothetical protein